MPSILPDNRADGATRLRSLVRLYGVVLWVLTGAMVASLIIGFFLVRGDANREANRFDAYYAVAASIQDVRDVGHTVTPEGRVTTEALVALKGERRDVAGGLGALTGPEVLDPDTTFDPDAPTAVGAGAELLAVLDDIISTGEAGQDLIFPVNVSGKFDDFERIAASWADAVHVEQQQQHDARKRGEYRLMMVVAIIALLLGALAAAAGRVFASTSGRLVDALHRASDEHAVIRELAQEAASGHDRAALVELLSRRGPATLGADRLTVSVGGHPEHGLETAATAHPPLSHGISCGVTAGADRVGGLSAWWHEPPPPGAVDSLARLANGFGMALESARYRSQLERQAFTDSLTGLPNHRAFHERLQALFEARGTAGDRNFAVALIDVDGLREINATFGHTVGDRLLRELARRLRGVLGPNDSIARISGGELAWIVNDHPKADLPALVDAARIAISCDVVEPVGEFTVSVGIACDTDAGEPAKLMRRADLALAAAKNEGRDRVVVYSDQVADGTRGGRSRGRLAQLREFTALQSLARAVDLRDQNTQRHSERVAAISHLLAVKLGWPAARASRLRQAALVHDVGKVGVPDSVLLKPGRLTSEERAVIETHPALSATIVSEVLDEEQVSWVRGHHERIDGSGYPDRLAGPDIPDGARIMAVADTWDAMTGDRPYRTGMDAANAIGICHEVSGTQLCRLAVGALQLLLDTGELGAATAAVEPSRDDDTVHPDEHGNAMPEDAQLGEGADPGPG